MTYEANDPTRSGSTFADAPAHVSLSRNEIEGLCIKAARGAGLPWGQAEEAGWAVGWLHAHGVDGASALLAHLERATGKSWADVSPVVRKGEWRAPGEGLLCPIAVGTTLSDFCELPEGAVSEGGLAVGPVSQPVLLLPFVSRIAGRLNHGVVATCAGTRITAFGTGLVDRQLGQFAALSEAALVLTAATAPTENGTATGNFECNRATLTGLNDLAMRITVPPSEKSRTDAGAATTDND